MIKPQDEYKALRDEMMNLFTRVWVVLVAMLTAFGTLSLRAHDRDDEQVLVVLLILSVCLIAGVISIITLYNNIYSIGSYIAVFLDGPGHWHLRSRDMRIQLMADRLSDPVSFTERINEPKTVSLVLFAMFSSLPVQFACKRDVSTHLPSLLILVVVSTLGCCLTWNLRVLPVRVRSPVFFGRCGQQTG
jgi:hypothetical protein